MGSISYYIEKTTAFFGKIAAFLVIALTLLIVYDASMRYLFHSGSVALQELEWHIYDLIFLLGLSYTLKHDKHVRVDIFYTRFSKKTKAIINILSQIFLILPFVALVLYVSWDFVLMSYSQHEGSSDPGGLCCRYIIKSGVILAFILLGLQSISEIYKNYIKLKGFK